MPTLEIELGIEFVVECSEHHIELDAVAVEIQGMATIKVDPCPDCIADADTAGHAKGYEDGYQEGLDEGSGGG